MAKSGTVPSRLVVTFPSSTMVVNPSLIALDATNPTALNARSHSIKACFVLTIKLSKKGLKGKEEKRQRGKEWRQKER